MGIERKEAALLQGEFEFRWQKEMRHLGINLTANWKKLNEVNYIALLNEIKIDLK